jgi:RIO kinase 1
LKRTFEDDHEEEPITFVKIKPGKRERARIRSLAQAKPTRKTSYESSTDVQRWLREQGYEDEEQPVNQASQNKPAFNPTLLASRRDAPWILSSLSPFYDQHLITDVLHEAHRGLSVRQSRRHSPDK